MHITQKQKNCPKHQAVFSRLPCQPCVNDRHPGRVNLPIIRALLNEFKDQGLRMIEVSRDDLQVLDKIRQAINELPEERNAVISSIVMT